MFAQFMRKQHFVHNFEDAWPEPSVQAVGSVNGHSRDFILFHRAKLVLLLPACEAKNVGAVVSLREISDTQSQEDFFTLRREGAKKAYGSKNPVSSLDLSSTRKVRLHLWTLAAWRLCVRLLRFKPGKSFTLRRQGAKKAFESKHRISSLNLSGPASLREPENCVERGLCRNAGEGAAGPFKSVLICGAARHFRFCLLSSYL